ncbi:DNA repair and recombination protein RadA [Thermofilum pendens]|uniref:DNA repair and recombination protein RadA n=1 Tax=Thermofilum pendens (strain DSM 2475 / Hrk 5) TaxID=368408 RepID=A1RYY7_THEPD|nr:DNA repair and recombination protein RadA [Thermofilum pendens]ABL78417.1 DNA repair and recombination protein RadA [Thermofilum pendens Hrk 5]
MPKRAKTEEVEEKEEKVEEEVNVDELVEDILGEAAAEAPPEEVPEGEIRLEDLEGVGRITAQKLRAAGFYTVRDLAFASAHELALVLGSEERAMAIIRSAQRLVNRGEEFITAKTLFEKRKNIEYISTGVRSLDDLLEGGIEVGSITEFIGEFGAGKTQICHQLSVMVQLPKDKGGLNARALYVDTEGTFRPERIVQIARARGLDPEKTLENIIYARAYNSDHQMLLIDEAKKYIEKYNIRLIIVDSLINHFRAEYPGRENLASRQQKLNKHISQLHRLASLYNLAVVVTNQVMASPDIFFGNPLKPAGGNIMAHGCTYRIWLRKAKEGKRIARIIDSPKHAEKEVAFAITEDGVTDV